MMQGFLRGRIGRLLGILLLLTAIVGGVGSWYVRSVSNELSVLASQNLQASVHLSGAERNLWELRFTLPNYVLEDITTREEIAATSAKRITQIEEHLAAYTALPLSDEERNHLDAWQRAFSALLRTRPHYFDLVDAGKIEEAKAYRAQETNPHAAQAVLTLSKLIEAQQALAQEREARARTAATRAIWSMLALVLTALGMGFVLSRALTREIADVRSSLQRSSSDLEATAATLLTGARELSAAATEVSTTLQALLMASKQIADSTRGVAAIARETGARARNGDEVVKRAQEGLAIMRARVDEIVKRMGHLGQSSEQIGGIVDIINELSEQTNILSINAAIEAVNAGEVGLRFGTVAQEIRGLASRVGSSARGIRELTETVRDAATQTTRATDEGTRAVAAIVHEFGNVLESFERINGQVSATTTAAREIETSTKHQTTAVAQVNASMTELARAAKDTEKSSQEMSQTCAELREVARRLAELTGATQDASTRPAA
ncbi:HAMP domain-containing methyl-accepting chemotaxis protein [Polyangium jinanense]|uniref:MCP four helix bundle domain-containing protein n=1 Tax=Polyangium jinanense TaxID=2829994 RepID=A0A9X4B0G3_9BACT|nr:methyl-accepting chemotaxis protein [Polyangium jinanense]MDC3989137.1 MCP four helix bundle domain-containing protein [Polyangium jinanense]